jgi:ABC-type transport system involved in multi-copper enzyme maturation permease subunit
MVWIAVALLVFAVTLVAINTAAGRWGMHKWRMPRRVGPTYPVWVGQTQVVTGMIHPSPGAHALQHAVLGSVNTIITPDVKDIDGKPIEISGFMIFSHSVVISLFLTFLLPIWSLAFATESIGGERESQSLIWLLSRPLSRPLIYLAKFVALLPWSLGLNLGGFALMCLVAGIPGRQSFAIFWPAVAWATLAFSSLFLLFGAYFRRPAVVAIIYSFCLEVVLGNMPGYLKRVSVGFYSRCLMYDKLGELGIEAERAGVFLPVDGTTALVVLICGTVALLGLGMLLFSRTQYHEVD